MDESAWGSWGEYWRGVVVSTSGVVGTVFGLISLPQVTFAPDWKVPWVVWAPGMVLSFVCGNFLLFHKTRLERDRQRQNAVNVVSPTKQVREMLGRARGIREECHNLSNHDIPEREAQVDQFASDAMDLVRAHFPNRITDFPPAGLRVVGEEEWVAFKRVTDEHEARIAFLKSLLPEHRAATL